MWVLSRNIILKFYQVKVEYTCEPNNTSYKG